MVGTWGGRPVADGNDGLANPCASMANIPVEVAESDWPILIERYGLVPDSGGAGRYRGGLAVERVWRALVPDTSVQVRSDRQVIARTAWPAGNGGPLVEPIFRAGRQRSSGCRRCSSGVSSPAMSSITGCRAAAAAATRSSASRRRWRGDVCDEKVSVAAARELYGVVIDRTGQVDAAATADLRRGKVGVSGDGSALLASAGGDRVVVLGLEPVFPGARAAGPAFTVQGAGGDNLALHHAVSVAEAGSVIVLAVGGERETAHCGEIVALAAKKRGIAGIVLDGAIRDPVEIAELGLPVFFAGTSPRGPGKAGPGALRVSVELNGVTVSQGDRISADADGIAVLAPAEAPPRSRPPRTRSSNVNAKIVAGT